MTSVVSVSADKAHRFSKILRNDITLIAGQGVQGDAHSGATVKHRSRVAKDPNQPNLRQVHLIHSELLVELEDKGFTIAAGDLGENILTTGIDLLDLSQGTQLAIGPDAVIQITGLRNPCLQLERFSKGLMHAVLDRDEQDQLIRKAGVMAIVVNGGLVSVGDLIVVKPLAEPHLPLAVV